MMKIVSRRQLLCGGSIGLAMAGMAGLVLRADAQPTPDSGDLKDYQRFLGPDGVPRIAPTGKFEPTEPNILGPYYRSGAPYRAKVCPPLSAGVVLLITGRIWSHATRKPLPGVVVDLWHADNDGHYDNDDDQHPPDASVFTNRTRLVTDETGRYEYETIHPAPYQIGPQAWRPSHIHYLIAHPGHKKLVTQLYFKGDKHQDTDQFIRPSLIIPLDPVKVGQQQYERGVFDIVLGKG